MKLVLMISVATVLGSCVGVQSPDAQRFANMVASQCRLPWGTPLSDRIYIMNLNYGKDGWIQLDLSSSITPRAYLRDNVYLNERRKQIVCGRQSWARQGNEFEQISEEEFRREETRPAPQRPAPTPGSGSVRHITVSWEGFLESADGTLEWEKTGSTGSAKLHFDREGVTCFSHFADGGRTFGTWSVGCGADRNAAGTHTYLGKDKGAIGAGKDEAGNQVKFTILPIEGAP